MFHKVIFEQKRRYTNNQAIDVQCRILGAKESQIHTIKKTHQS